MEPESIIEAMRFVNRSETALRTGGAGVSPAQYAALRWIADQAGTGAAGRLAAYLGVNPAVMTGTVDRLASKGFVARTPDHLDRRVTRLAITPAGRAALERATAALRSAA